VTPGRRAPRGACLAPEERERNEVDQLLDPCRPRLGSLRDDDLPLAVINESRLIWRPNEEGHFGLRTMHERAEQLGGQLHVRSAPGAGTCVVEITQGK
jgi:glucose-6-phosphate-specific signal transduction histidine kinase